MSINDDYGSGYVAPKPPSQADTYQQMADAGSQSGINNMSGSNTTQADHYSDGSSTGDFNPNGTIGLPTGGGGSSSSSSNSNPPVQAAPAPEKPKVPSASETLAQIHREEWEDWKKRFQPRIEDLARQATTGELTTADINRADGAVMSSFSNSAEAQQIRESRLGIQRDGRQAAASERMLGLNKTAARASARNNTRIAGEDRDMQILAGGGNIGLGARQ